MSQVFYKGPAPQPPYFDRYGDNHEYMRQLAQYINDMHNYVNDELTRLGRIVGQDISLPELHAEPDNIDQNAVTIVAADGTDWDPGSGQGVYAYYNSTWNKL